MTASVQSISRVAIASVEERYKVVDRNTVLVNLDAPVVLPGSPNVKIVHNNLRGSGWAKVSSHMDQMYINGQHVEFCQPEELLRKGVTSGRQFYEYCRDKPVLHNNILDAINLHESILRLGWWDDDKYTVIIFPGIVFDIFHENGAPRMMNRVRCLMHDLEGGEGEMITGTDSLDGSHWDDKCFVPICKL
jgi:hypothetical protein